MNFKNPHKEISSQPLSMFRYCVCTIRSHPKNKKQVWWNSSCCRALLNYNSCLFIFCLFFNYQRSGDPECAEIAKLRAFRALVPYMPSRLNCLPAFAPHVPLCLTFLCALLAFVPLCLCALRALAPYVPWSLCALITRLASIICAFKCLSLLLKTILEHSKRKLKRNSVWNVNEKSFWLIFI